MIRVHTEELSRFIASLASFEWSRYMMFVCNIERIRFENTIKLQISICVFHQKYYPNTPACAHGLSRHEARVSILRTYGVIALTCARE